MATTVLQLQNDAAKCKRIKSTEWNKIANAIERVCVGFGDMFGQGALLPTDFNITSTNGATGAASMSAGNGVFGTINERAPVLMDGAIPVQLFNSAGPTTLNYGWIDNQGLLTISDDIGDQPPNSMEVWRMAYNGTSLNNFPAGRTNIVSVLAVKVSSNDRNADHLEGKITGVTNQIVVTVLNDGADETLQIGIDPAFAPAAAPQAAKYVVTEAHADLPNEFNLGGLAAGLLKHTVASGVSTPATAQAGTDYVAPAMVDAKGDLIVGTADNTVARVPVGTNGQQLIANSTPASGMQWVDRPIGMSVWIMGKPDATVRILQHTFFTKATIPVGLAGSQIPAPATNPTADTTFTIKKRTSGGVTTTIGTIEFEVAGTRVLTFATATTFDVGDMIYIESPAQDATLEGVEITIKALQVP